MDAIQHIINILRQRSNMIVNRWEPIIPAIGLYAIGWVMGFHVLLVILNPQFKEFPGLRILESIMALPLLFLRRMTPSMRKIFPYYFLFFTLFSSPFFVFFTMMKNEWELLWVLAAMSCVSLIIIVVADWLLITSIMTFAYALSHIAVTLQDGEVRYTHFDPMLLPLFIFSISGTIIVTGWLRDRNEDRITLMKSLSGTIAHEMRSPLNAITLAIDAIKAMLPERADSNGGNVMITDATLISIHDIINQGDETIRRSNKIIDSILASLKGTEIDRRQFRRLSAQQTVTAAIDSYGFENPEDRKLVHLNLSDDFLFFGDNDLLSHTLFNLLGNALYYRGKPGFRIDITISTGHQGNRIVVRDTGPGIARDKREAIFNQFYTFGKSGGNGIGLSFCRRVAESFGGSIACCSTFGEWTEFIINLPHYDSNMVELLKRELLAKKQILVVDDQGPNRILISKYLADLNCRSDQAENGQIALEMAAKKRYDLILMDIEMPVLNGDDAVMQLRAGNDIEPSMALHYREIPIIAITGLPEDEAKHRAMTSGMNDFALKPLGKARIKEIVDICFFSEKPDKNEASLTGLAGASILLVDDNIMTREFLKALLEPLGYRIFQAENGILAIDMLREQQIDLIVMDLEMPVMGGIETAKVIRNEKPELLREVPIITLSGYTDEQAVSDAKSAGINLHLGKPVRKHELLNAIATLLARSARHDHANTADEAAPKSPWAEMESVPILDESIIESLQSLGDESFLVQLFSLFVQDADKIIGDLEEACRQNDHDKAQRSSHTLKGSAASIGAARIQAIATRVNELLRNRRCPEEEGWIEYLRYVYRLTTDAFSNYTNQEKQTIPVR